MSASATNKSLFTAGSSALSCLHLDVSGEAGFKTRLRPYVQALSQSVVSHSLTPFTQDRNNST